MRYGIVSFVIVLFTFGGHYLGAEEKKTSLKPTIIKHNYRPGKSPKTEFKVEGKSYKIDPESAAAKHVRSMPPNEFDPATRRQRVEEHCRKIWHDWPPPNWRQHIVCGPFRHEFILWVGRWPAVLRAQWAWHHRQYIDSLVWTEWMASQEFAAEVNRLQKQNFPAIVGFLPKEYADTSPVLIYNDEYLDAVYNPIPFLAVMTLKNLRPCLNEGEMRPTRRAQG